MVSLQKKYGFEMSDDEFNAYVLQEEDEVIATLKAKAQPCVGATEALEKLHNDGQYKLAVVSSSALRRVKASIEKVHQDRFFPPDWIFSAATSLPKPTSKPDPAIYLHACKVLGVEPAQCVAVEDSKSGATSAVRAGIPTLGYVGSYGDIVKQGEMKKVLMEDVGVKVVMDDWKDFFKCLEEIEKMN